MTDYGHTDVNDPRIPVGTRVRYTEREDDILGKFYDGQADGVGVVAADDGTGEAPYRVVLDNPYPSPMCWAATDISVLADYNELEILP